MNTEDNLLDFEITVAELFTIRNYASKESANVALFRMRKKLKKPAAGILLASEYGKLKGISLRSVYDLAKKKPLYTSDL